MSLPDSRCFIEIRKLFTKEAMIATIEYFNYSALKKWSTINTDKDRERLEIGSATDAFRLDRFMFNIWNGCDDAAEQFRPFTWVIFPPNMRHIHAEKHLVPWHQDIAYIRRMKQPHRQVVTCFVPLELEPSETSTLEFAAGDFPELPHVQYEGHGACIEDFCALNESIGATGLECGECLIFGDHTPHCSIPGPTGRIDRRSIEFRMVRPQDAIAGKDYFDLKTRKFIVAKEMAA